MLELMTEITFKKYSVCPLYANNFGKKYTKNVKVQFVPKWIFF